MVNRRRNSIRARAKVLPGLKACVISKEVIAVFINGGNVPCLRVDNSAGGEVYGSVGLWIGAGSAALVADFRIHEVRSEVEKEIGRILGRRAAE
jgi:hypothetical protein